MSTTRSSADRNNYYAREAPRDRSQETVDDARELFMRVLDVSSCSAAHALMPGCSARARAHNAAHPRWSRNGAY